MQCVVRTTLCLQDKLKSCAYKKKGTLRQAGRKINNPSSKLKSNSILESGCTISVYSAVCLCLYITYGPFRL
ncbi:hypothetical protein XELAEV_18028211mg [Xenopus laevis]|uniref:Uncharacterized protein n=1 Tax=Xenopus laevis TaxID=8355 RepID=A0A974HKW4_XENLA|nr:hypothetical protein XELAEV_18028211mg [Xenopus laevis]